MQRPRLLDRPYFDGGDNLARWSDGETKSLVDLINDLNRYAARAAHVITVDQDGNGDFTSIEAALDSFDDEADAKRYVIIPSPGIYRNVNAIVRPFTGLCAPYGFGPGRQVVLTSSSGKTLQAANADSLVQGIQVVSESSNSADVALCFYSVPAHTPIAQSFLINGSALSTDKATALEVCPLVGPVPTAGPPALIYAGAENLGGGKGIVCDQSGIIYFLGGGGGAGATIGVELLNGSFGMFGAEVGISANPASGLVVSCDASFFVALSMRVDDGLDGIKLRNGSIGFLIGVRSLGGVAGTPVDTDPSSFLVIGDVSLDSLGSPSWQGWSVLGPSFRLWTAMYGFGSTGLGGPDQRPSGIPAGYQFFATDRQAGGGAGAGSLLTWNGSAWIDTFSAIVP